MAEPDEGRFTGWRTSHLEAENITVSGGNSASTWTRLMVRAAERRRRAGAAGATANRSGRYPEEYRPPVARSCGIQRALHVVVDGLGVRLRRRRAQAHDGMPPRRAVRESPIFRARSPTRGERRFSTTPHLAEQESVPSILDPTPGQIKHMDQVHRFSRDMHHQAD